MQSWLRAVPGAALEGSLRRAERWEQPELLPLVLGGWAGARGSGGVLGTAAVSHSRARPSASSSGPQQQGRVLLGLLPLGWCCCPGTINYLELQQAGRETLSGSREGQSW